MILFDRIRPTIKLQDEKIMTQVQRKLLEWTDAIPIYGFNSSGYDINVFRNSVQKYCQTSKKIMEIFLKLKRNGYYLSMRN